MKYLVILIVLLTSCSTETVGIIKETSRNKIIRCIDSRDNSVFMFNTNTINKVNIDTEDVSVDITTLEGNSIHFKRSMEFYINCNEVR